MPKELYFYALLASLTGGMIYPFRLPRMPNVDYLIMKLQKARSLRDKRCAHHQAGMRAQMVNLATRYRGER